MGSLLDQYSKEELESYGYTKMDIEVNIEAKRSESNEGDHYMYLMRSLTEYASAESKLWETKAIDQSKSWKNWYFKISGINFSQIGNDGLVFFYDAGGNGNDDWYNKNFQVKITIS